MRPKRAAGVGTSEPLASVRERLTRVQAAVSYLEDVNKKLDWVDQLEAEILTAQSQKGEETLLRKLREMGNGVLKSWQLELLKDFSLLKLEEMQAELRAEQRRLQRVIAQLSQSGGWVPAAASSRDE
eukprot:gnl/TRDRNA2_/TRDRNA2_167124_c0_seq3.p2 gnl/TRDRNA2_/TRDRNA2_167124_c0~~gnl/TRDRNA2_/TRDRNA2_167124_c0_seq3.p2  ORF type:complete len:127 (+),score=30.21 gnl/TRDRNA2_/TRDRNA2_167124_c0_seq3:590-970(+)